MSMSESKSARTKDKNPSESSYNWRFWAKGTGERPTIKRKAGIEKKKYYAVKKGRIPGVYDDWVKTEKQVVGFPGAIHKAFYTLQEAQAFVGTLDKSVPSWTTVDPSDFTSAGNSAAYKAFMKALNERRLTNQNAAAVVESGILTHLSDDTSSGMPGSAQIKTVSAGLPSLSFLESGTLPEPTLTPQQADILARILKGQNFFFTGSAGTGKSVLLRAIIKAFRENYAKQDLEDAKGREKEWEAYLKRIDEGGKGSASVDTAAVGMRTNNEVRRWKLGVTASTGMAGVNIGGSTLHAWAGLGLAKKPVRDLIFMVLKDAKTLERWRTTGALIIDEISMIDGVFLDKLETIARSVRADPRPFGGIQIILSGDFFQLPPVGDVNELTGRKEYKFCFDADCWNKLIPLDNIVSLTKVFRQNDDRFVRILEGMRKGHVSDRDMTLLRGLNREIVYEDGVEAVQLWPRRAEVAQINQNRLDALKTSLKIYEAHDAPGVNSKGYKLNLAEATKILDQNTTWPKELSVKVGATVMLVTNLKDGGLVNGSTGKIVDFVTLSEAIQQNIRIPNLQIVPSMTEPWPVVEFIPSRHASATQLGVGGNRWLIPSMRVEVTNAQGETEAERYQVPLMLAWALTVHKAQGQSLERVRIDLGSAFTDGQSYVAISRATSLEGLELFNFSKKSVMASQRVLEWALPIEEAQKADEEWDNIMAHHEIDF